MREWCLRSLHPDGPPRSQPYRNRPERRRVLPRRFGPRSTGSLRGLGAALMSTGPRGRPQPGGSRVNRGGAARRDPKGTTPCVRAAALSHRCGPLPSFGSFADRPAVRRSRAQSAVTPWHTVFQPRSWPSQAHYKQAGGTAGDPRCCRPSYVPDDRATSDVDPLADKKSIARSGARSRDRLGPKGPAREEESARLRVP